MHAIVRSARPPFLVLTPICVLLGFSMANYYGAEPRINLLGIILIGALGAHLSVNWLNEYQDFASGLDLLTERTPFSGGSGALPEHPKAALSVLYAGITSLLITCAIGGWLLFQHSAVLLPFGLIGVLLVVTYTQWINRMPWLCLIAPGLGFGLLMTQGTHLLFNPQLPAASWWIAAIPFLLINNLLLLNQYPDLEADRNSGRKHFPIRYGIATSNLALLASAVGAYAILTGLLVQNAVPPLTAIAYVPAGLALIAVFGAFRYGAQIGAHPPLMACNVAAACLTPLSISIALKLG